MVRVELMVRYKDIVIIYTIEPGTSPGSAASSAVVIPIKMIMIAEVRGVKKSGRGGLAARGEPGRLVVGRRVASGRVEMSTLVMVMLMLLLQVLEERELVVRGVGVNVNSGHLA